MQGERLNVDSSVTRKQCGQIDHIVFCNASERRVISMYMTNEEWEQNNQDYLKESYIGKRKVQELRTYDIEKFYATLAKRPPAGSMCTV